VATSDPIAEIIGDYRAFAAMQRDRLVARGIDIAPYPRSAAFWLASPPRRSRVTPLVHAPIGASVSNGWTG
jgi:hypothetical protein